MALCSLIQLPEKKRFVKFSPVVNIINILQAAFAHADPKCAKTVKSSVSLCTFGTYVRKSLESNVDEIFTRYRRLSSKDLSEVRSAQGKSILQSEP